MDRRGDISEAWLKSFVIIIVVAAIILFGYRSFTALGSKGCRTEIGLLVQQMRADIEPLQLEEKAVVPKEYVFTCGDQVYLFDTASINISDEGHKAALRQFPLILEELSTGSGRNFFLLSGNRLDVSSSVGALRFPFPYYACFQQSSGRIKVLYSSWNGSVSVNASEPRYSCVPTIQQVKVGEDERDDVIEEALGGGGTCDAKNHNTFQGSGDSAGLSDDKENEAGEELEKLCEDNNIELTDDKVDIHRLVRFDEEKEKTHVSIVVKSRGEDFDNFIYLEQFPKDCLGKLSDALESEDSLALTRQSVKVKDDPLMMWNLGKLKPGKDKMFGYSIKKRLDEPDCEGAVKGVGVSLEPKNPLTGIPSSGGISSSPLGPGSSTGTPEGVSNNPNFGSGGSSGPGSSSSGPSVSPSDGSTGPSI